MLLEQFQWAFGAKMTLIRRIDVNTKSFLRHVPGGISSGAGRKAGK